jgi:hypothetical protein
MDTTEDRIEYSEHLWITTGVPGDDQESSFMNATLQSTSGPGKGDLGDDLEFSIAVHVGVPGDVDTEEKLRRYLHDVFQTAIEVTEEKFGVATLNVVIEIGPAGSGEDD